MRDMNSLYSDYLVSTIIQERQDRARQHGKITLATANRPSTWQRLMQAVRTIRPASGEPVCEPTALTSPKQVTTS